MKMAGIIILLFAILTPSIHTSALGKSPENTLIVQDENLQAAGPYFSYLKDPNGLFSIKEVTSNSKIKQFQPIKSEVFNVLASKSVFWFKVTVQNQTNKDLWLQVGDPFSTWHLDFYSPDIEGHYNNPVLLGALRPQSNKFIQSNLYCVPLSRAENQLPTTYYFRIESNFPETHVFKIGSLEEIHKDSKYKDYIASGFIGIMLAMVLYNLFLLISLRQVVYLYYLCYLVLITVGVSFSQGFPLFYQPWMWHYYMTFQLFIAVSVFLFTSKYLDLYRISKRMYWVFATLTGLIAFAGILNLFLPDQFVPILNVTQAILFVNNAYIIAMSIRVWRKGFSQARFFVFGWVFALLGILIFLLAINGMVPLNHITSNSLFIGISLEAVMFALALADYWNILKKEKELLQHRNLSLIQKQKSKLEELVEEKTKELQSAYNESSALNAQLKGYNETLSQQKKKLETALRQKEEMQNQLVESEKMATLGVLAAGVAHEINNPLNFIKGGVEVLEMSLSNNPAVNSNDYRQLLDAIQEGITRAASIVISLNDFSHTTKGLYQLCKVHRLIRNCVTMVKHELKKGVNITMEYHDTEILISGNSGKLHQVFLNILTNAIDAIEGTGEIRIITQSFEGLAIIDFIDSGKGIKQDQLKRILEPFFTTKQPGRGTGLGLSIAYSIIKEHNGSLSFTSAWGEGTTVRIVFPLANEVG